MTVTLEEIRAVALGLPRTHEGEVRGRVKFYVGRIVFVAMARDETMMGFGFPKEFRDAALEAEPEKFVRPEDGGPPVQLARRAAGGDRPRGDGRPGHRGVVDVRAQRVLDEWLAR